jgi:hypothetical protein
VSIQPGRVVWRIVDEVARGPRLCLELERWPARAGHPHERVEVVRSAARMPEGGPPCPTLFHFWTHALQAVLELHGQGDQLEGVAGYAMCERLEPPALEAELVRYRQLASSQALPLAGRPQDAYRMMDGPCRGSLVVETDLEWCALFRSHGPRVPLRPLA